MAVEVRCMKVIGNYLYTVIGDKCYMIDWLGVRTYLGTLGTSTGAAWIEGDGTNLCVCDTSKGYSYVGTTWAEIAFPDGFAPSSLTYMDGYFIVSRSQTGRFYISALLDPTTWDPLDFSTADGDPDDLVCVHALNRDLWLLGKYSTEIWNNTGNADFPFERVLGGYVNVGCRSARSVASSTNKVFWFDDDQRVRMGTGVQSEILSTMQIDYQISLLANDADVAQAAIGFYYTMDGHEFYQLTIGNETWCFDVTTGYWHKRASGTNDDRHPAQCYAWYHSTHLVGHYSKGNIYEWDRDTYTNDGDMIRRIRSAQTVHKEKKRIFHSQLVIDFEAGVGNADCADPQADLVYSDDDGHTWSSTRSVSIGVAADYEERAVWRRLGNARGRVYKVTIEDPVKTVILAAHLEAERGRM